MVTVLPVVGLPEIVAGDDVAALIARSADVEPGDIVVVTSKIISKAAGLYADRERPAAVLAESVRVVAERATPTGVTRITQALAGPVMAGAGIDASNAGDDRLLVLPRDPDRSAAELRDALIAAGAPPQIGVILSDTSGRPWRAGLSDFALGTAHLHALDDLRGRPDSQGRDLAVTVRNLGDEIAAAADLVKGKVDRVPVAIVRGLGHLVGESPYGARDLVRTGPTDWFGLGQYEAVRAALGIEPGTTTAEAAGIPFVGPEGLSDRARRAVRLATRHTLADVQVALESSHDGLTLTATSPDPQALGYFLGRCEVACTGEVIEVHPLDRSPNSVTLLLRG